MTHNKSINEDFTLWPEWAIHVNDDVRSYKKWCEYWINMAEEKKLPVLFLRFEDLITNPEAELKKIFPFILRMNSIEGTVVETRIEEVVKG
jgi:hypothetical protein